MLSFCGSFGISFGANHKLYKGFWGQIGAKLERWYILLDMDKKRKIGRFMLWLDSDLMGS